MSSTKAGDGGKTGTQSKVDIFCEASDIIKNFFIPASALFAEARLATIHTKQNLQQQLSSLGADPRLSRLPRAASVELKELVVHAVKHNTSAPDVWQAILGGINENSSTGLRKWASKQGRGNEAALLLESILLAKEQDSKNARSADTWTEDADWAVLKPWAKESLNGLISKIPKAVQVNTHGHPHCPFFHRIKSALESIANYDPNDDDVVPMSSSQYDGRSSSSGASTPHGGQSGNNTPRGVGGTNNAVNNAALNAQRQAAARNNAAAAVAAANAAAAHWPPAPPAVTRSATPLIRKVVREGEIGSDGQPIPARPGGDTPSNVLWVRVTNVVVPVTLGALYELFGVHGKVQKIVLFDNRGNSQSNPSCQQAFVQYPTIESAVLAWSAVDGFEYASGPNGGGSNLIRCGYSNLTNVAVEQQSGRTWDFTKPAPPSRQIPAQTPLTPAQIKQTEGATSPRGQPMSPGGGRQPYPLNSVVQQGMLKQGVGGNGVIPGQSIHPNSQHMVMQHHKNQLHNGQQINSLGQAQGQVNGTMVQHNNSVGQGPGALSGGSVGLQSMNQSIGLGHPQGTGNLGSVNGVASSSNGSSLTIQQPLPQHHTSQVNNMGTPGASSLPQPSPLQHSTSSTSPRPTSGGLNGSTNLAQGISQTSSSSQPSSSTHSMQSGNQIQHVGSGNQSVTAVGQSMGNNSSQSQNQSLNQMMQQQHHPASHAQYVQAQKAALMAQQQAHAAALKAGQSNQMTTAQQQHWTMQAVHQTAAAHAALLAQQAQQQAAKMSAQQRLSQPNSQSGPSPLATTQPAQQPTVNSSQTSNTVPTPSSTTIIASQTNQPVAASQPATNQSVVASSQPSTVAVSQPVATQPAPVSQPVATQPAPVSQPVATQPAPVSHPVATQPAAVQPVATQPAAVSQPVATQAVVTSSPSQQTNPVNQPATSSSQAAVAIPPTVPIAASLPTSAPPLESSSQVSSSQPSVPSTSEKPSSNASHNSSANPASSLPAQQQPPAPKAAQAPPTSESSTTSPPQPEMSETSREKFEGDSETDSVDASQTSNGSKKRQLRGSTTNQTSSEPPPKRASRTSPRTRH